MDEGDEILDVTRTNRMCFRRPRTRVGTATRVGTRDIAFYNIRVYVRYYYYYYVRGNREDERKRENFNDDARG